MLVRQTVAWETLDGETDPPLIPAADRPPQSDRLPDCDTPRIDPPLRVRMAIHACRKTIHWGPKGICDIAHGTGYGSFANSPRFIPALTCSTGSFGVIVGLQGKR